MGCFPIKSSSSILRDNPPLLSDIVKIYQKRKGYTLKEKDIKSFIMNNFYIIQRGNTCLRSFSSDRKGNELHPLFFVLLFLLLFPQEDKGRDRKKQLVSEITSIGLQRCIFVAKNELISLITRMMLVECKKICKLKSGIGTDLL